MLILNITNWNELLIGSLVGIVVVFTALAILVLCFMGVQHLVVNSVKKKKKLNEDGSKVVVDIAANEIAAISMALHLFLSDVHDEESNIITIKRIERRYSPWNSKIYGLNNTIHR